MELLLFLRFLPGNPSIDLGRDIVKSDGRGATECITVMPVIEWDETDGGRGTLQAMVLSSVEV